MNKIYLVFLFYIIAMPIYAQQLEVKALTCEYRVNPIGIATPKPLLSWKIQSTKRNTIQAFYQILVADNLTDLKANKGNVWDSKKIASKQSINVLFNGSNLSSTKKYYWKVKVWDNNGNATWSEIAHWQMGLLNLADWKGAQWIAYEKIADSNINILPVDGKKDTF